MDDPRDGYEPIGKPRKRGAKLAGALRTRKLVDDAATFYVTDEDLEGGKDTGVLLPWSMGTLCVLFSFLLVCAMHRVSVFMAYFLGVLTLVAALVLALWHDFSGMRGARRWTLTVCVLLGLVTGFVGGVVGGNYVQRYYSYYAGQEVHKVSPTASPSKLLNPSVIHFTPSAHVAVNMAAAHLYRAYQLADTAADYRYQKMLCVAPVLDETREQREVSFWATATGCCNDTSFSCDGWNKPYGKALVVKDAAPFKSAVEQAEDLHGLFSAEDALYVVWTDDPSATGVGYLRELSSVFTLCMLLWPVPLLVGLCVFRSIMFVSDFDNKQWRERAAEKERRDREDADDSVVIDGDFSDGYDAYDDDFADDYASEHVYDERYDAFDSAAASTVAFDGSRTRFDAAAYAADGDAEAIGEEEEEEEEDAAFWGGDDDAAFGGDDDSAGSSASLDGGRSDIEDGDQVAAADVGAAAGDAAGNGEAAVEEDDDGADAAGEGDALMLDHDHV